MSDLLAGVNWPLSFVLVLGVCSMHRVYQGLEQAFSTEELSRWRASLDMQIFGNTLTIHFPHKFFADWFTAQISARFEQALAKTGLSIVYQLQDGDQTVVVRELEPLVTTRPFGHECTFDNFLVNAKNYFPLASAKELVQSPEVLYNPFVLCGESGTGKSFLLRAIANAKNEQGHSGLFVAGIEEVHELYTSREDARKFLSSMTFLGVDDLQDIVRHQYLQREFLALFDHFHAQNKQMAFACTGKVAKFGFLTPRLKSRLEWGLIVSLKGPDLDIRTRYAARRSQERRLDLSQERLFLLAQRFSDLRNLEGCIVKFWAYQELMHREISDEDFENILKHQTAQAGTALSVEQILDVVATWFDLSQEELLSASRKQSLVFARHVAMFLCRKHLGLSFPELGRAFGGRDHSTVLYGCRKIEDMQQRDKDIKELLHELSDLCLTLDDTESVKISKK